MTPLIGLIGGTGLGTALLTAVKGEPLDVETPFGKPSAPIVRGQCEGVDVAFLARHGPGHTIPPTAIPYRANIYALKSVGVTHILASGATGSLREEIHPQDLVVADQVIDKTFRRVSTFFDERGLAAHVDFAEPFCPRLRSILVKAGESVDATVHDGGTYVCMEGPAFSTIAESRMHRSWGGDLIGMTCMPEAKLAREAEMCYALLALPTDYDSWKPHDPSIDRKALMHDILANLRVATENSVALFRAAVKLLAEETVKAGCMCQSALDLGVWTDRGQIPSHVISRLSVILGRHFQKR